MSGSNIGSGLGNYRGPAKLTSVTVDENTMIALHGDRFTPVDLLIEQMGEALFDFSDSLRSSRLLESDPIAATRYATVAIAWRGLTKAIAMEAREGGDGEETMEIFKTAIHKLAIEIERGTAEPRAEYDAAIERLNAIATDARSDET